MSHLAEIQSDIKDLSALQSACKRLGVTLGPKGNVRFYLGAGAADHVIAFPGKYDLGFKAAKDGYQIVGDNEIFLDRKNGRNDQIFDTLGVGIEKLFEEYNYSILEAQAAASGYGITRQVAADGGLDVVMESYA